jgi:hypothetical protein
MTVCLGLRQATFESFNGSYSSNCSQTYFKAQKCGIKTIHGQNFYYLQHYLASDAIRQYNTLGLLDQTYKGFQRILDRKLKCGDIKTKVNSNFTAIVWREKRNVNILTNMHSPPA